MVATSGLIYIGLIVLFFSPKRLYSSCSGVSWARLCVSEAAIRVYWLSIGFYGRGRREHRTCIGVSWCVIRVQRAAIGVHRRAIGVHRRAIGVHRLALGHVRRSLRSTLFTTPDSSAHLKHMTLGSVYITHSPRTITKHIRTTQ